MASVSVGFSCLSVLFGKPKEALGIKRGRRRCGVAIRYEPRREISARYVRADQMWPCCAPGHVEQRRYGFDRRVARSRSAHAARHVPRRSLLARR